jgi:hypothetical protein
MSFLKIFLSEIVSKAIVSTPAYLRGSLVQVAIFLSAAVKVNLIFDTDELYSISAKIPRDSKYIFNFSDQYFFNAPMMTEHS